MCVVVIWILEEEEEMFCSKVEVEEKCSVPEEITCCYKNWSGEARASKSHNHWVYQSCVGVFQDLVFITMK
jgi:hypothetical protein